MIATAADSRYAPGVALIAENANLKAGVHKLEKQVDFYRRLWELEQEENDRLHDRLWEVVCELPRARAAGERAERRRRDPYLRRIYGISVGGRGHAWRNRA